MKETNLKTPNKARYLWLDELSTKEAAKAAADETVIIFPIGSTEEHGSHLPLCTDSLQSEYIAIEVAKKTGCLIAPPFRQGICNAGHNFPGTISIEFNTLYLVTRDILSELTRNGFNRIIILTGHAGSSHMTALKLAAQKIVRRKNNSNAKRKTRIMVLSDYDFADELKEKLNFPKQDGHAGAIETSRIMAIKPELIKDKGQASFPKMPRFEVIADPERYFPSGVMGDPTVASEKKGKILNQYIIEQVAKLVEELKKT
jgi:creatinine amidohydrolase